MPTANADPAEYPIRVEGSYADDALLLIAARIEEGVNLLTRIEIEFVANTRSIELKKIVGDTLKVVMESPGRRIIDAIVMSTRLSAISAKFLNRMLSGKSASRVSVEVAAIGKHCRSQPHVDANRRARQ